MLMSATAIIMQSVVVYPVCGCLHKHSKMSLYDVEASCVYCMS